MTTVGAGAFPLRPLGDVVEFLDSRRRPITAHERDPGPIPYYGANGVQDHVRDFLFDEPLVLLAEDGGHFEDPGRGIAYGIAGKSWVNNHAHVLRPKPNIDFRFLVRVLEHYDARAFLTGSTRAKLTKHGASRMPVPVPPVEEQRRIAAVLDKADDLRAKRRATIAQLDTLTESIFLEMFGDSSSLPHVALQELLSIPLRNGVSPASAGRVLEDVLTLSAITGPAFRADAMKSAPFAVSPPAAKRVDADDLLICRGNGNRKLVGRGHFPATSMPNTVFPDTMIAARVHPDRMSRAFLAHIWNRPMVRRQVESLARTTNGTFKVNQEMLEGVLLPEPPLERQREFANSVGSVRVCVQQLLASVVDLDDLFSSLQQRAFRGEL